MNNKIYKQSKGTTVSPVINIQFTTILIPTITKDICHKYHNKGNVT